MRSLRSTFSPFTNVQMTFISRYPTSEMYNDMVDSLIREYPHLLSYGGLPAISARAYWKDKIVFKFGNARKSFDKNHPDVFSKKRKKSSQIVPADMPKPDDVTTFTWGLRKYLPDPLQSEDETSLKLHVQSLQREFRKTSADVDIVMVDMKMKLTFPYRRHLIVTEKKELKYLIEEFPWLQLRSEVLKESERLQPNIMVPDLEGAMTSGLSKYRSAIVSLLRPKKKANFLKELETSTAHFRTSEQRNYVNDCYALAGLPLLFKEKPENVVKFEMDDTCPLYIHVLVEKKLLSMGEEEFTVIVEGVKLCCSDILFSSLLCAGWCHICI